MVTAGVFVLPTAARGGGGSSNILREAAGASTKKKSTAEKARPAMQFTTYLQIKIAERKKDQTSVNHDSTAGVSPGTERSLDR